MHLPRVILAYTGSRKTMLACAITKGLINAGLRVSSFTCGTDYVAPMVVEKLLGISSRNLDTFLTDENTTKYLISRNAKDSDIAVIEGMQGMYDGVGTTPQASSYDLARLTGTPVVLIVPSAGMNLTMVSMLKGVMDFKPDSNVRGIIINQCSRSTYVTWKPVIEEVCGVPVIGYIPNVKEYLPTGRYILDDDEEIASISAKLDELAVILPHCIDFDRLRGIAESAQDFKFTKPEVRKLDHKVRIGIANDSCFQIYYKDNLELLEEMGAEFVEFSTLDDRRLPAGIQALFIGGGHPENYAQALSMNTSMLQSVKDALTAGMPCIAIGGGFQYLREEIEDVKTFTFPMVGYLPGKVYHAVHSEHLGHMSLTSKVDSVLGPAGTKIRGHESHCFETTSFGDSFTADKADGKYTFDCMYADDNVLAGFPHIYLYSNPDAAFAFIKKADSFKPSAL